MASTDAASDVLPGAAPPPRPFFGRPYAWVWFAVVLAAVPLVGYMLRADLGWTEVHPAVNAMLNGTASIFLAVGWFAIRRGDRELHRLCMVTAFTASSVFLASYLARFALSGAHRYPGDGWDKLVYLIVLFSHMVLAAAVVPMVLRTLLLAWRGNWPAHRRLARWTWPVWMYVSVTGVVVYAMLYHLGPALH